MLGRLVADMYRPLDAFAPQDPAAHIKIEPVMIADSNAKLVVGSVQDNAVKTLLGNLLSLDLATGANSTSTFESTIIKTYRLQNQSVAFDKLIGSPAVRQAIEGQEGLLLRNKGVLYMVVGMKTCFNATITTGEGVHRTHGAGITVPFSLALGVPFLADVGLEASRSRERSHSSKSLSPGEQIFALEYRKVTQLSVFRRPDPEREPQISRKVKVFPWEQATFRHDDEDYTFEDDDDQQSNTDLRENEDAEVYQLEDPEWHAADCILRE